MWSFQLIYSDRIQTVLFTVAVLNSESIGTKALRVRETWVWWEEQNLTLSCRWENCDDVNKFTIMSLLLKSKVFYFFATHYLSILIMKIKLKIIKKIPHPLFPDFTCPSICYLYCRKSCPSHRPLDQHRSFLEPLRGISQLKRIYLQTYSNKDSGGAGQCWLIIN